jgi:hypothetical protein
MKQRASIHLRDNDLNLILLLFQQLKRRGALQPEAATRTRQRPKTSGMDANRY